MTPIIKTPRQRRALAALAASDGQSVKQLQIKVGQNNIPQLMASLRCAGWRWTCEIIEVIDQDGKKCRPGVYRLTPEHRKLAAEMLES
ncbi:hypothetical protein [Candidatus Methylomicrobium oryzae]|uniref:hypothetical protein n=1 Tax=Candidatus Methylomicrobium oryzae TaxID=2802053 RepID=UPI0019222E89|nr:hypothetical protein [Methylomicrobium sp. RS1]MBL1265726.1 hypothetical protein [Methylomicrobium sp. RS1]